MARPPLFTRATVARVVKETDDARTFVLRPESGALDYVAGQFCTFRVAVDGDVVYRSYSMSSAPECDVEPATTIKRVPGGRVSNWLLDNVSEGDTVELTRAAGTFVLRPGDAPLLGFSGGSGITPIVSITKSALATTDRSVRLLCADRDRDSAIFAEALTDLEAQYPGRLEVVHHLDDESGYLTTESIASFVGDDAHADCYICGPEAFMAMVENSLTGPGRVFVERFGSEASLPDAHARNTDMPPEPAPSAAVEVTITHGRTTVAVPARPGETILEAARRGGLTPPFSCEAGNCATCIARITSGTATMRVNDALEDDEIEDGYILTCQGVPDGDLAVTYED